MIMKYYQEKLMGNAKPIRGYATMRIMTIK